MNPVHSDAPIIDIVTFTSPIVKRSSIAQMEITKVVIIAAIPSDWNIPFMKPSKRGCHRELCGRLGGSFGLYVYAFFVQRRLLRLSF